jgi:hypothetical protein
VRVPILELFIASIHLVYQQHRSLFSGVLDRLEKRPLQQELGAEELGLVGSLLTGLG